MSGMYYLLLGTCGYRGSRGVATPLPLFTQLPRRGLLGNPVSIERGPRLPRPGASLPASCLVSVFAGWVRGVLVARAAGYSYTSGLLLTLPRRPFQGNLVRLVRGFGLCRLGRRKFTRGRQIFSSFSPPPIIEHPRPSGGGFALVPLGTRSSSCGRRPCKHALCFLRPPALCILAASEGKEVGPESLRRGYSGPQEADTS